MCIRTVSGKRFFPFAPNVGDVVIEDIAHALSMLCCFSGQTRVFYSLAQHCIHVSRLLHPRLRIHGILLRADAAYLGSAPTIVQVGCRDLQARAIDVKNCIYRSVYVYPPSPQDALSVEIARDTIISTEARDILGIEDDSAQVIDALDTILQPMSAEKARDTWLIEFAEARNTYER